MIGERLAWAAAVADGRLLGADRSFSGVSTDTRRLTRDELFVALSGPNFDAHDFIESARERGATGAVVERVGQTALAQIVVADARRALGQLARAWRQRFAIPIVAITGSNGKTTVKTLLGSILLRRAPTLVTRGNLNNEIGVPLTLFELGDEHRRAVVELGANHAGEIAALAGLALPDVGLVTNAGPAHLEGFGSLEGVARAKGELFAALPAGGTAVLNVDDPFASLWRKLAAGRPVVGFGRGADADVRVGEIRRIVAGDAASIGFELITGHGSRDIALPLPGAHNAVNAAAAAAAALALGESLDDIAAGLASAPGVAGRLNVLHGPAGARLIDDSYNANPASLRAALDLLLELPGRAWIVLGDMAELGENALALHSEFGAAARRRGVERLYTVGELSRAAAAAFGPGAQSSDAPDELVDLLRSDLAADVNLLIKGSRCMRLETLVDALASSGAKAAEG